MTNFEYEERYGERVLSDYEQREEEQRIEKQERLEELEIFLSEVKQLIKDSKTLSKEELIGEIKWIIKSL